MGSIKHLDLPKASQQLLALFQATTKHKYSEHQRRLHIAHRIGFMEPIILPVIYLHRLPSEYPPRHQFVLENSHEPIPELPSLKDRSCRYPTQFHILDQSCLAFTLPSNQSAQFVDIDTGERIAVVIRNFARNYFPSIQQWSVPLLHETIWRRTLSQQNNPGKLAHVGVTTGARNARLFG